jgi:competence protein ComEA
MRDRLAKVTIPPGRSGVEPKAAPWRALEDPTSAPPQETLQAQSGSKRTVAIPRSAIVTVGLAVVLSIGAFVVAFGSTTSGTVALDGGTPFGSADPGSGASQATLGALATGRIVVEIVGAVEHPGVFRLPVGSRVGDVVEAAGGYGPRVDADRAARELNLAAQLRDGDQVRVPSRDDITPASSRPPAGNSTGSTGPLDLNAATPAELEALPGIGPATAAKIIGSREGQPFVAVADLRSRKLVGEKTFEQLRDLVTVR